MSWTADQHLFVDTCATGHLLSTQKGLQHFLVAAHAAAAEVIILDPLYSTHDQDENVFWLDRLLILASISRHQR
jgi:hypothetical protein